MLNSMKIFLPFSTSFSLEICSTTLGTYLLQYSPPPLAFLALDHVSPKHEVRATTTRWFGMDHICKVSRLLIAFF